MRPEERGIVAGFPHVDEAGFLHQRREDPVDAIPRSLESIEELDLQECQALEGSLRPTPISEMNFSAGFQETEGLHQGAPLVLQSKMVEDQA
jgi:hypothetical protein